MNPGGLLPVVAQHPAEEPVLFGNPEPRALTERLVTIGRRPGFFLPLLVTGAGSLMLFTALAYTAVTGIGTWGNNIPVGWAFDITNFVWWIGIGHAGTFISAILFLLEQRWRTSINRFAEAMTLFAVANAAVFPLMHLGRPWFFYWLIPYPSSMMVWPQFRSALTWDVAAISTYGLISLLFWYLGLVPDLAAARDLAPPGRKQRVYAFFALGWRGAASHWRHYRMAYLLLAGLATPLVLSVHSVVSMDFATGKVPGWHSTVFPPYFVAGAIFSGFAMVLTLLLPARKWFGLGDVVTARHLDAMSKMLLLTGSVVAYAYLIEHFLAWYGGNTYEMRTMLLQRPFGPYGWLFWVMVLCNAVAPQLLWWPKARRSAGILFVLSIVINIGMWAERFVIIAGSLATEYTPSSWDVFVPTVIDGAIFFGTLFFFSFLFLLFLRLVPFIPISELKEMQHVMHREAAHG